MSNTNVQQFDVKTREIIGLLKNAFDRHIIEARYKLARQLVVDAKVMYPGSDWSTEERLLNMEGELGRMCCLCRRLAELHTLDCKEAGMTVEDYELAVDVALNDTKQAFKDLELNLPMAGDRKDA